MDRYQICCSCGSIGFEERRLDALVWASSCANGKHRDCLGPTVVFDRMAHYGRAEMWEADGTVLSIKERMEATS